MQVFRRLSSTWHVVLISFLFLGFGCRPALKEEAKEPEQALTPVRFLYPRFCDDLDFASLAEAIERNLEYLNRLRPGEIFRYGSDAYTCSQVIESQKAFLALIRERPSTARLNQEIRRNFKVYRSTGRVGNKKVLFTGYFEPVYEASLTPSAEYRFPLYRKPDDLLTIDLSPFKDAFKGEKIVARIEGKEILPYFTRKEIDGEKSLAGRHLEIAWLKDPIDAIFLQIQGSGRLMLPDGACISVGYQASNGRPYRSIGAYMVEKGFLSGEQLSMQTIRAYLSDHPATLNQVLNYNPSYVFFKRLESGPLGNINVVLTPQRSLALDADIFPKGALAFVSCQKPTVDDHGRITGWVDFSRFMLNQDTGGAIKGAGRADIFCGSGTYAEAAAGHLKHDGDLFILIKKF